MKESKFICDNNINFDEYIVDENENNNSSIKDKDDMTINDSYIKYISENDTDVPIILQSKPHWFEKSILHGKNKEFDSFDDSNSDTSIRDKYEKNDDNSSSTVYRPIKKKKHIRKKKSRTLRRPRYIKNKTSIFHFSGTRELYSVFIGFQAGFFLIVSTFSSLPLTLMTAMLTITSVFAHIDAKPTTYLLNGIIMIVQMGILIYTGISFESCIGLLYDDQQIAGWIKLMSLIYLPFNAIFICLNLILWRICKKLP